MSRFAPYVRAVTILVLVVLMVIFANSAFVPQVSAPVGTPAAPSTISVLSDQPSSITESQPSIAAATSTQKVSTPKTVSLPAIMTKPNLPQTSSGSAELNTAASALRAALVNIVCYVPAGSPLHSISGSGVFVASKGIILTNAHVAQYFLLSDKGVSCTIRAGSPAVDKYDAELVYISPLWIRANASVLSQTEPIGTGQYDFALLAVSGSATTEALPGTFPFLPLATTPPNIGTPVVIASYGAQFLAPRQVQSGLYPTVVFGSVKDVFTFATNTIDFLALGGSAAAQEGSSGGGVIDASGKLVGTITTSTVTGATDTRSLGAITASYIRAEYASEMGSPIDFLLAESPSFAISDFAPKIPTLEAILTANLP